MNDSYVYMRLPRDTGVRLRVEQQRIKLLRIETRRWWQFWKPKHYPRYLATESLDKPIAAGSTVTLEHIGGVYSALINGRPVLSWPRKGTT